MCPRRGRQFNIVSRTVAVGLWLNGANVVVPAAAVAANYLLNDKLRTQRLPH